MRDLETVSVQLSRVVIVALDEFIANEPDTVLTHEQAVRRLLTNSLVGLGLLPIPDDDGQFG